LHLLLERAFIFDDIIWLNSIVEKLAWKHNVLPSEVEEVLRGKCKIYKKKSMNAT